MLYLEPNIRFEGFIMYYDANMGISKLSEDEKDGGEGVGLNSSGQLIVLDAYD